MKTCVPHVRTLTIIYCRTECTHVQLIRISAHSSADLGPLTLIHPTWAHSPSSTRPGSTHPHPPDLGRPTLICQTWAHPPSSARPGANHAHPPDLGPTTLICQTWANPPSSARPGANHAHPPDLGPTTFSQPYQSGPTLVTIPYLSSSLVPRRSFIQRVCRFQYSFPTRDPHWGWLGLGPLGPRLDLHLL